MQLVMCVQLFYIKSCSTYLIINNNKLRKDIRYTSLCRYYLFIFRFKLLIDQKLIFIINQLKIERYISYEILQAVAILDIFTAINGYFFKLSTKFCKFIKILFPKNVHYYFWL